MCNLNLYDYEENFSKRLIELRGQKNQQEICDTIGITTATLRRYEKGETKPDMKCYTERAVDKHPKIW